MIDIQFPEPQFKLRSSGAIQTIFDPLRKKWLQLTPEEWVRQNFVQYLVSVMNYPATLIAMEKKIRLGELTKRFDILVYDKDHKPWMIVECKGDEVKLDQEVLQQALRYNISVPARYIIITNGNFTYAWEKKDNLLADLNELPGWK
jgi:hypothetical protein